MPVRPTVRCLHEDLGLPVPSARVPLEEIDHPLLRKAAEQFASGTPHERIRAIDDVVLFKVKTGRWRGAVYSDDPGADVKEWLVAAGTREEDSPDDFYAALHAEARAARQRYNADHDKPLTTDTYAAHLLPGPDDRDRYLVCPPGTRTATGRTGMVQTSWIPSQPHSYSKNSPDFWHECSRMRRTAAVGYYVAVDSRAVCVTPRRMICALGGFRPGGTSAALT
jgi:hypothetical protein